MVDPFAPEKHLMKLIQQQSIDEIRDICQNNNSSVNFDYISKESGRSLLYEAVEQGNCVIVGCLLTAGANPNKKNIDYFLPLHRALSLSNSDPNYIEIIQCFLKCPELELNKKGFSGRGVLQWTRKHHLLKILMASGASVDMQDDVGTTPLMEACQHGDLDLLNIFLRGQPDLTLKNINGKTAVHVAEQYDDEHCGERLRQYITDLEAVEQAKYNQQIKNNFEHVRQKSASKLNLLKRKPPAAGK